MSVKKGAWSGDRIYRTCRTKIHATCTVLFSIKTECHTAAQVDFEPAVKPGMTLTSWSCLHHTHVEAFLIWRLSTTQSC